MGWNYMAILLISLALTVKAADWNHDDRGESWENLCKTGEKQSPIDFDTSKMKKATYEDFTFVGYDRVTKKDNFVNNAHTVQMESTYQPQVYGGGLPGIYQFAQFHLHWGSVDSQGSEHTINQKAYPMELHLVHFKTEYGNDIGSAIANEPETRTGKNDNLAVLGIMFEIQDEDNEALEPMMNALEKIASTDIKTKVNMEVASLKSLLPKDTKNFYRYQGSLTTPGCNQIVVWTVFKESVGISAEQMAKFRQNVKLNDPGKTLVDNYRAVQPLNGRKVQSVSTVSFENIHITVESSGIHHLITLPILMMTFIHMLVL